MQEVLIGNDIRVVDENENGTDTQRFAWKRFRRAEFLVFNATEMRVQWWVDDEIVIFKLMKMFE